VALTAVVAHRGAPDPDAGIAENTVAAFQRARELGADGVELDVRLTADGALAVHHDAVVPGGGPVADLRTSDLPEHVPLLDAALDATEGLSLNIEVKNIPGEPGFDPEERLARLVGQVVAELGPTRDVLVSSFWPPALTAVRDIHAEARTGLLYARPMAADEAVAAATARGCRALHPAADLATLELVVAAHAVGLEVCLWTVNDRPGLVTAHHLGVDTVITDDVTAAREVLGG
jgi:glycerophosphoryl diester phosphodiesterase